MEAEVHYRTDNSPRSDPGLNHKNPFETFT